MGRPRHLQAQRARGLAGRQPVAAGAGIDQRLRLAPAQAPCRKRRCAPTWPSCPRTLLEGRGTGQRGGELTVTYLETQAMAAGLLPANGQLPPERASIAGVKAQPQDSSVALVAGGKPLALSFGEGLGVGAGRRGGGARHGRRTGVRRLRHQAPEEGGWDDYKGLDVKGKVLVMLVNDPAPTAAEPNRFNGKGLTYYGRWTYKFEEAARRGAAGVLLIHTDARPRTAGAWCRTAGPPSASSWPTPTSAPACRAG
jgi:hypothetical protein